MTKILRALSCDLVITLLLIDSIEAIRRKQARKSAEKQIRYLKGTMNLEDQEPDPRFIAELIKQEEARLLQGSSSKLWEKMPKRLEVPDGATPIDDCSGLIPLWVHSIPDLNRVEAENILNAQRKYLGGRVSDPKNWFQIDELLAIHKAMFGEVWEWAGKYRKSITSIGVAPNLIPTLLAELCVEVLSWLQ